MLWFLAWPGNDNAGLGPDAPGFLLAPMQMQRQPAHSVERMVFVGGLQPLDVRLVRCLTRVWMPVVPSSVYPKYLRVMGEPSWVDLVQDG